MAANTEPVKNAPVKNEPVKNEPGNTEPDRAEARPVRRGVWGPAARLLLVFTGLTGLIYPAAVTGLAQVLFPEAANGSLVRVDGVIRGSHLLGQAFEGARWFWGRPSAVGHDPKVGGASNLGPSNPALHAAVAERVARVRAAHPEHTGPVPVDLVTTSGSGLDPHLSPAAVRLQVGRVAAARGLPADRVAALVEAHTEGRLLGLWGAPRVNVLALNLALDRLAGPAQAAVP